jgi:hypothetical protein
VFTRDGLHSGRSMRAGRGCPEHGAAGGRPNGRTVRPAATLSRCDPDPCRGRAAFALMGEFNLLIAGHQANCVAQQRYALDCNPIHRGDHITFGEASRG